MRTIKFKGKCLNPKNGKEFAYGSLLTFPDGSARIFEHDHDKVFNYFSVDPTTVCQFTGFYDTNGKKIYEGDVLCSDEYPYSYLKGVQRDNYFAVVYYCEERACFGIVMAKNPLSKVLSVFDGVTDDVEQVEMKNFEVVGNIHEDEWKQYGEHFLDNEDL